MEVCVHIGGGVSKWRCVQVGMEECVCRGKM